MHDDAATGRIDRLKDREPDVSGGAAWVGPTARRVDMPEVGVPAALGEAWITEPALAVEIDVTDVFHQTPGPGTGEKA